MELISIALEKHALLVAILETVLIHNHRMYRAAGTVVRYMTTI
jgi:hypothetical protein